MYLLSSATLFSLLSLAFAVNQGDPCSIQHNALQPGTYQFISDCGAQNYCGPNGQCVKKKCRKDDFPFGYSQDSHGIPDKCKRGSFCPDEGDECQPQMPPGSACQLNRDDQCIGPDDFVQLADHSGRGLNYNGSVCLNNVCMWANVTLGQKCVVENTAYIAYGVDGEFVDIVSRGNCRIGFYCDSQQLVCMQSKSLGAACAADKECDSYNCSLDGRCEVPAGSVTKISPAIYAVVAIAVPIGILGTLFSLYWVHKGQREEEREKRLQYWREQNAFHQNLLQMRDTARQSLVSLHERGNSSQQNTVYSQNSYVNESQSTVFPTADSRRGHGPYSKRTMVPSSEDENSDEDMGMNRKLSSRY